MTKFFLYRKLPISFEKIVRETFYLRTLFEERGFDDSLIINHDFDYIVDEDNLCDLRKILSKENNTYYQMKYYVDRMLSGEIAKWLSDACLLNEVFSIREELKPDFMEQLMVIKMLLGGDYIFRTLDNI